MLDVLHGVVICSARGAMGFEHGSFADLTKHFTGEDTYLFRYRTKAVKAVAVISSRTRALTKRLIFMMNVMIDDMMNAMMKVVL